MTASGLFRRGGGGNAARRDRARPRGGAAHVRHLTVPRLPAPRAGAGLEILGACCAVHCGEWTALHARRGCSDAAGC